MPFTRWIKTPTLLVIMAVLLVVSPFSALAEEASSDATQAESASIQEEVTALEASESSVSESSEPEVSVQAEGVVEPEKAESDPVSILSDAPTFYLQIAIEEHSNALGTVPTFEVGLSDASSKQIAKATASPSNYNEEKQAYELAFQLPSALKEGDTYHITLLSASPEVKGLYYYTETRTPLNELEDEIEWHEWRADVNEYIPVTLDSKQFYDMDDNPSYRGVLASKGNPLRMVLTLQKDVTVFYLKDTNGNPLKNQPFTIVHDGKKVELKSDDKGVATIKTKSLPSASFAVITEGRLAATQDPKQVKSTTGYHTVSLMNLNNSYGIETVNLLYHPPGVTAQLGENDEVVEDDSVAFTITTTNDLNGTTNLSDKWGNASLDLTNSEGNTFTFSLTEKEQTFYLPAGEYKVSVTSENANAKLSVQTLKLEKGKKATIGVTLTPKYILSVDKDGRSFNFKFLNVDSLADTKFSGTDAKTFAVSAGEVYMVQDIDSGKVNTVVIASDQTLTKLVLGAGVVFGGTVTTPHTGDDIVFLIILLVFSALLAGGFYFLHWKKKKTLTFAKQALSILLVATLIGGIFPVYPQQVYAEDGQTSGGSRGDEQSGKTKAPAESIKTSNLISIIQVGFRPADDDNNNFIWGDKKAEYFAEEAYNGTRYIFTDKAYNGYFYVATTPESHEILTSNRVSLYTFDWAAKRPVLEFGTDGNSIVGGSSVRKGSNADFQKRVIKDINSSNQFVALIRKAIQKQGGYDNSHRAWVGPNSASTMTLGEALQEAYMEQMREYFNLDDKIAEEFEKYREDARNLQEELIAELKELQTVESKIYLSLLMRDYFSVLLNLQKYTDLAKMVEAKGEKYNYLLNRGSEESESSYRYAQMRKYASSSIEFQEAVFKDYLKLLDESGVREMKDLADHYRASFSGKNMILFAQMVPGFYRTEGGGKRTTSDPVALFPMQEAVEWFLAGMIKHAGEEGTYQPAYKASSSPEQWKNYGSTKKWTSQNPSRQSEVVWGTERRGTSASAAVAKDAPTFTFIGNARETFAGALRVNTKEVPALPNPYQNVYPVNGQKSNPTAGWSFLQWYGHEAEFKPQYKTYVHYVQFNGKLTEDGGRIKIPLDGIEYVEERSDLSGKLEDAASPNFNGMLVGSITTSYVTPEGDSFVIFPQIEGKLEPIVRVYDEADEEHLTARFSPNKSGESNPNWGTVVVEDGKFSFMFGTHIPSADTLYTYLGGRDVEQANGVTNKYYNRTVEDTSGAIRSYSNARIDVYIPVVFVRDDPNWCKDNPNDPTCPQPKDLLNDVPQWRLSKFFSTPDASVPAYVTLSRPNGYSGYVATRYNASHTLATPILEQPSWLQAINRVVGGTPSLIRNVSTSQVFNVYGDFLAIRHNTDVDNIRLASWLGISNLFDSRITSTSQGQPGATDRVTVKQLVQLPVKPNYPAPMWHYTYTYACGDSVCIGRGSAPMIMGEIPGSLDLSVRFNRYRPAESNKQHNISPTTTSVDGLYTETKVENTTLKVNPEVAMVFSDISGNSGVSFAAADRLREIKPVTYNTIRYRNPVISPQVNGLSVATDPKASDLATRLNASGTDVIYKGSATTNSVAAEGVVEFKTYALDIGNTPLKQAWNPGTSYNTQAINREFLSRFLTFNDATGKWEATFNTHGKYLINNADVGGVAGMQRVEQDGTPTSPVVHTLEIRGGRLVGVDGNRDLSKVNPELMEALKQMGITPDNKGIFVQFESGTGAQLTDEMKSVYDMVNQARGVEDWRSGRPWYNEDTTVLVVHEYTTIFQIPDFTYSDKIPMSIQGIESPADKNDFFSKGYAGHMEVRYSIAGRPSGEAFMTANTQKGHNVSSTKPLFSVPNVSVQDTFSTVR